MLKNIIKLKIETNICPVCILMPGKALTQSALCSVESSPRRHGPQVFFRSLLAFLFVSPGCILVCATFSETAAPRRDCGRRRVTEMTLIFPRALFMRALLSLRSAACCFGPRPLPQLLHPRRCIATHVLRGYT